jgi:rhamnogalacturonyl hydrolase YesR
MNNDSTHDLSIQLFHYAKDRGFSGWDPYDGLNSRLLKATGLDHNRLIRLAWIQFFKRCPINLRPLLLVPKGRNPKGIALFASSALNLYRATGDKKYLSEAVGLLDWLRNNFTRGYSGPAWGYNFPWQSRADLKPAFSPTIVATAFIAQTFLDGYDATGDTSYRDVATGSARFILNDLNIHREGSATSFSYGPKDHGRVYNATALGAQFFARLYRATNDGQYRTPARNAIDYVVSHQRPDGAWAYGDHDIYRWTDSFHTGFNLIAIKQYREFTGDPDFEDAIKKGFAYYQEELFTPQGFPKYYSTSFYPVDIHTCAVAILMFREFGMPKRAQEIVEWTVDKLWNKKGWFDYQLTRYYRNSIPYMRWSQAWILYALTNCLKG